MSAARRALLWAGDALGGLSAAIREVEGYAAREQFAIAADGSVTDVAGPVMVPSDRADEYHDARARIVAELGDRIEQILRRAGDIDQDLTQALAAARSVDATTSGDLAAAAAAGEGAVGRSVTPPPDGGSPGDNAGWWDSLSDQEKREVIEQHPDWIGNLDGVDAASRDEANRHRLVTERDRLEAELTAARADLADNWFGGFGNNDDARVAELEAKLASLDVIERTLGHGDRALLVLDLGGERAKAAIANGDVDSADHVAVFTPGLTTTVDGSMASYDARMADLRARTEAEFDRRGSSDTVATVAWLGYEAPQNRDGLLNKGYDLLFDDDRVISEKPAQRGGEALASFLTGINTSRDVDPHLTALGHSYGSATTGYALRRNTGTDDVVFFGSPGIGTSRADDVRLDTGAAYLIEARNDAVADLGGTAPFGIDPSHMPGLVRLESGEYVLPDGRRLTGVSGHSAYLDDGSTSQYNMAVIVGGYSDDRVEGDVRGVGDVLSWPVPWTY